MKSPTFFFVSFCRELKGHGVIFSTDEYFTNDNGVYKFDYSKLSDAHEWNQKRGRGKGNMERDGTTPGSPLELVITFKTI